MLADKDRIFTNLYGFQDWGLKAVGSGEAAPHSGYFFGGGKRKK